MAQSTKKQTIRDRIDGVAEWATKVSVPGRWVIRRLLLAHTKDTGLDVIGLGNNRPVFSMMQNEGCQYKPRDIGYLITLHNLFPEMDRYRRTLEQHNSAMRGTLIEVRKLLKHYQEDEVFLPPPPELMKKVDDAILHYSRMMAENRIPDYAPVPATRHRALRIDRG
jgi:hypothetical protein